MKGRITRQCRHLVKEAARYYITEGAPEQADILIDTFNEKAINVCKMPEIGRLYEDGMRKIKLGKFPYYIYYKATKKEIVFLGIWHTSRGTEFEEA
jgi:plasmid stabilization system protein ParE